MARTLRLHLTLSVDNSTREFILSLLGIGPETDEFYDDKLAALHRKLSDMDEKTQEAFSNLVKEVAETKGIAQSAAAYSASVPGLIRTAVEEAHAQDLDADEWRDKFNELAHELDEAQNVINNAITANPQGISSDEPSQNDAATRSMGGGEPEGGGGDSAARLAAEAEQPN